MRFPTLPAPIRTTTAAADLERTGSPDLLRLANFSRLIGPPPISNENPEFPPGKFVAFEICNSPRFRTQKTRNPLPCKESRVPLLWRAALIFACDIFATIANPLPSSHRAPCTAAHDHSPNTDRTARRIFSANVRGRVIARRTSSSVWCV